MCSLRYCLLCDFCYDIDTVALLSAFEWDSGSFSSLAWFVKRIWIWHDSKMKKNWHFLSICSVQRAVVFCRTHIYSCRDLSCSMCVNGPVSPPSHRYSVPAEFISAVMKREGDWYQWGNWFLQAGRRTVLDTNLLKYQCGWFLKVSSVLCVCLHKPKHCMRGWWCIINAPSSLFSCYHYITFKGEVSSWTFVCVFDLEERGWGCVSFSKLLAVFPLGSRVFFKDFLCFLTFMSIKRRIPCPTSNSTFLTERQQEFMT